MRLFLQRDKSSEDELKEILHLIKSDKAMILPLIL